MRRLKKTLIVCIASLILFSIVSTAFPSGGEAIQKAEVKEEYGGITLSYSFEKPLIESGFRVPYKVITIPGLSNYAPPGEPVVPFKTAKILIPYGEEVQDIQVILGNKVYLGKFYLQPAQEPLPLSYRGKIEETLPKEMIYNSMEPYPKDIYSKIGVQWKRGYQILILNLYPVEYIPKSRDVSYFENMRIIVETKPGPSNELFRGLPEDREDVLRIVDNPEIVMTYCPKVGIARGFQYPVEGYIINGYYFGQEVSSSRYHLGEDVIKPAGTKVYACADGIVKLANNNHSGEGNYGGLIIIEHNLSNGEKVCSLYGHLDDSKTLVRSGSVVKRGQQIGEIGRKDPNVNGNSTPHLHFGIRYGAFPGEYANDPNTTSGWYWGGYGKIDPKTTTDWWIKPSDFIKAHYAYEYVIITNEELKNAPGPYNFQKLAEWKDSRGIRTRIVTVEEIYANYTGIDNQTKIRNFIIDAYLNGTNYVLSGGDADGADVGGESGDEIVPIRKLWACGHEPDPPDIASDLYYACLDGSYDSDGDGIYGEPNDGGDWPCAVGEDVDLNAEVYVGRAPVDCYEELSNFVRKTISYENSSINDPYLRGVCMVGELLWDGGCSVEEAVYKGNVANPEEILNSLRDFRDKELKTDYVELYYEYSPDIREILTEDPNLLMESARLIVKYMPAVRYMTGDKNGRDLKISEKDVKQVISFTERLKSEIEERREKISIERSSELIKLLEEFEEQFKMSEGKTFSQALRSSVYFDSKGADIAERLGKTWGGDYKDEIKNGSCNHGYCTKGFPPTYNVSTLYDRDYPGHEWPKSEIINIINNNTHIINHLGHANVGKVMKMNNSDVDALTNDKYFFGYSQGCYAGSFDNQGTYGRNLSYDCIAEHFVTNTSGSFAFIANSRYGIGARGSTDGVSQRYDRQFWDAVFGEGITNVGVANQDSKEDNVGLISDNYMRFCYYELNLLGDPETPIFLLKPEHDIQVKNMVAPEKIVAGKLASINATIENIGKNDESNIFVQLLECVPSYCTIKNVTKIGSLLSGSWVNVSFSWTSNVKGDYMLKIYAVPVSGETSIDNNYEQKMVRVFSAGFTDNYTDFGEDTNGDALYNYLVVNVGVGVASAGTYKVRGEIYENGTDKTVEYASNRTYLNEGEQIVQLKFDGIKIRKNKYNGTYDLKNLELYEYELNGTKRKKIDYREYAYTTNHYNWTDFQKPSDGPGPCAVEEAAYKGNVNNPEEVLNSLREFRDEALKTEYVKLYYEYSPDVREILLEEPDLLMGAGKLIMKYTPAVRYVIREDEGRDLKITKEDVEKVISFTERLKEEIREREEKIGVERNSELIKLLEELEEQWNASIGMNFSQAFRDSVYFESNSPISSEGIVYVPDNYSIIQDAIDEANISDKIIVRDGTYTENIIINKPLTIKSENGSTLTIVQAEDSTRPAFKLIGYNINISGFTIKEVTNYEAGMSFIGAYLSNISNNNISDNDYGIKFRYSSNNNTLSNNIVLNNGIGIYIESSDNNTLTNNTVSNSGLGIRISSSTNNTIYLNNFVNSIQNAFSLNSANTWNSTEKINYTYHNINYTNYMGNYWDDYTGSDTNNDGIGDTISYNIDSDKDDYPLMERFENYFAPIEYVFDTGSPASPYPSISGMHYGTIKPNQTITVNKLYTYPCPGTGGHTEYVRIYNESGTIAEADWTGYAGDWHNISFDKTVVLLANKTYNYTIRTGSYPQIHHTDALPTASGWINCTKFVDANGKSHDDWIPAIRLFYETKNR